MNPKETKAVALHYDGAKAPTVTAKGEGLIAKQIIDIAKSHEIPINYNPDLTALLSQVRLTQEIPNELYVAVAQILAIIYHFNGTLPPGYQKKS